MAGAGGGPAIKESILSTLAEPAVVVIGARLQWHGALSFDYIRAGGTANFVDCNPRLVEPMAARYARADLAALLLAVSCGDAVETVLRAEPGSRTRLAIQALLGTAAGTRSRARSEERRVGKEGGTTW